jgi:VWFA-related protein
MAWALLWFRVTEILRMPKALRSQLPALLLVLSAASPAPAESPAPQDAGFSGAVEVTVVNLDVYVRDREGRPVLGLQADDFRLLQDGVEVPISNFAVYSGTGAPMGEGAVDPRGAAPPATLPPSRPVSVVLYIDNVNLRPLDRNRVITRLRDFVVETLAPPVEMMVVAARPSLAVRQPFTDDVAAVTAALEGVGGSIGGLLARDQDRKQILDWMGQAERNPRSANATTRLQVQGAIFSYVEQESDILEDSLASLHELVRLAASRGGRSAVIYVSNGLPMIPGVDLLHQYETVFRDISIYTRIAQRSFDDEYRSLVQDAAARGVSLYSLDASGLNPLEGFDAADRFAPAARAAWVNQGNLQDSLQYMADGTGGLAVLDTNDVSGGLGRIRDDLASYYSLGYTVSASGEDRTLRLEVELPGHPKLEVRHRRWLVEKSPATRMRERVAGALFVELNDNPMRLELSLGEAVPRGERKLELPLQVSIPLASLEWMPGEAGALARLELVVGIRDGRGEVAVQAPVRRELRMPGAGPDGEAAQRVGVVVPLLVEAPPAALAVGLRDLGSGLSSYARLLTVAP